MKDYLKVYKVTLHTLSPVFIGSGREINKKEYRRDSFYKKIIVYDPGKLYAALRAKGKSGRYEDFLLNNNSSDLDRWMSDNRVSPREIASAMRYSVAWGDSMDEGNRRTAVMEFMKDPYGNPYVPGTSIKGMLRTILLAYEISNNKERYNGKADAIRRFHAYKAQPSNYKHEADSVEQKAFRKLKLDLEKPNNAVNDVLQGLIISDSKPLSVNNLVLCQKIDYFKNGDENAINILRESLRPGTDIEFTLTIDTQRCCYNAETIMKAIEMFNDMYYDVFASKFKESKAADNTVYLGGGVGFVSKTFIYPLFGKAEGLPMTVNVMRNTMSPGIFNGHRHYDDERIGVSPHMMKCTRYDGKRYQMGMCSFKLEKIN